MPKQPVELMFGTYRRQLLATLLLRPGERSHVRELGRMTGLSPGSIHRELAEKIDIAFVFGCMATGRQARSSDVDVIVLGAVELIDVVKALSPVSK